MQNDSLGFVLADCARLIRRRFDVRARTLGVSRAQWQVLVALSRHEGINQSGLADYLEVETITLCRMADRLQDAGLIERRADPADRRAWKLYLTEPANLVLGDLRTIGEAVIADALEGIADSSRQALVDGLLAIRTNLSARTNPALEPQPATDGPGRSRDGPGRSRDGPVRSRMARGKLGRA